MTRFSPWALLAPIYGPAVASVGWHARQAALVEDVAGGRVLDVGCGPGFLARILVARGVDYTGIDLDLAMARRAMRASSEASIRGPGRARVLVGDLRGIPFDEGVFDLVVSTGVLGLLTSRERRVALREIARVARSEVRMIEPFSRPDSTSHPLMSKLVAFVRERPLDHGELADAGFGRVEVGRPVLAGIYSELRATVGRGDPQGALGVSSEA
jgi:SAM-dependent methyltransferase